MIYRHTTFFVLICLLCLHVAKILTMHHYDQNVLDEYQNRLKTQEEEINRQLQRLKLKDEQLTYEEQTFEINYEHHKKTGDRIHEQFRQHEHKKILSIQEEEKLQRMSIELQNERKYLTEQRNLLRIRQKRILENISGYKELEELKTSFRKEKEEIKELQKIGGSISQEKIRQLEQQQKELERQQKLFQKRQQKLSVSSLEYIELQADIEKSNQDLAELREKEEIHNSRVKILHQTQSESDKNYILLTQYQRRHQEEAQRLQEQKDRLVDRRRLIDHEKECLTFGRR